MPDPPEHACVCVCVRACVARCGFSGRAADFILTAWRVTGFRRLRSSLQVFCRYKYVHIIFNNLCTSCTTTIIMHNLQIGRHSSPESSFDSCCLADSICSAPCWSLSSGQTHRSASTPLGQHKSRPEAQQEQEHIRDEARTLPPSLCASSYH